MFDIVVAVVGIFIGLAVVVLILQMIWLNIKISSYDKVDFTKKALAERQVDITLDRTNALNVYSVVINQTMNLAINRAELLGEIKDFVPDQYFVDRQDNSYNVLRGKTSEYFLLPLAKSSSSEALYRDVINNKINYLNIAGYIVYVSSTLDIEDIITQAMGSHLLNDNYVLLISLPLTNALYITSFLGSNSTASYNTIKSNIRMLTVCHIIGYRV